MLYEQDFSSKLGKIGQKDADKIIEVFNSMMVQLKEERLKVREQNFFLDLLIKSSPMGVIVLDIEERIATLNPVAIKIIGENIKEEEFIGKRISELFYPIIQEVTKLKPMESRVVRQSDGNIYKCTMGGFMNRGFRQSFYLIEKMTEELLVAEKKAYSEVIRMISHEVNNSMAGVSSSLEIINSSLAINSSLTTTSPSLVESDLQEANELAILLSATSERCLNLSRFITRFAEVVKIPEPQITTCSLNDFIRERIPFLESLTLGRDIKIVLKLADKAPTINMDPVLMEQVVVNIIKNAIEAINEESSGEIIIETGNDFLKISNNGEPISEAVKERLFTPFFSTKPNGQGVGLILIREILIKHRFGMWLITNEDGWTEFGIRV